MPWTLLGLLAESLSQWFESRRSILDRPQKRHALLGCERHERVAVLDRVAQLVCQRVGAEEVGKLAHG